MPTTSGGIRYPASTDAINIPLDMQNLANDVQTYITANALTTTGTYTLTNKKIGSTGLTFTGSSGQTTYTTTLQATIPTSNQTITFPNATGTVSLLTATEILSNKSFASTFTVNGGSSGAAIIAAPAAAGTPTLTLPIVSGTFALTDDIGAGEMLNVMGVYGS